MTSPDDDPPAMVDANVFVRVANAADANHDVCNRLLLAHAGGRVRLATCAQTYIEFWAVATRPVKPENGLGLPLDRVEEYVRRFAGQLPPLDEPPNAFALWRELAVRHAVKGKATHDARYVAVVRAYGLRRVVTLNGRHFRRFAGVEVLTPAGALAAVGG